MPFLSGLTNRVLIAFDNDRPGKLASQEFQKKLNAKGMKHHTIFPKLEGWDDYFDRPDLLHSSRIYLNNALLKLK